MKFRLFSVLAAVLLLWSCKDDDGNPVDRGRSQLHIVCASTAVDSFHVSFDYYNANDVVIDGFFYTRNWPIAGYADLQAGGEADANGNGKLFLTLYRQDFANDTLDTISGPKEIILGRDERSTICMADSFGKVALLKFKDEFTAGDPNVSLIRFINLDQDNQTAGLQVAGGGASVLGISFASQSSYISGPTGSVDIEAVSAGNVLATLQDFFLVGGGVYTFYLSGNGQLNWFRN